MPTQTPIHKPVLLSEVLEALKPQPAEAYLDLTAGYGGHATSVLAKTKNFKAAVLVDRDESAVSHLRQVLSEAQIKHQDFESACQELLTAEQRFDIILADLGVSSLHLDNASRGFAFSQDGPLDMRMDQSQSTTAADIVNKSSETELVDILRRYGEEPKAHAIAKAIMRARPITSTQALAKVVASCYRGHLKRHPATRTFQALRIAVNDELGQLERALPICLELLKPGGRLAIISFHSLEDRTTKQFFAEHAGNGYDSQFRLLTKHPITATTNEIALNPRARSAKLRLVVKNKNKERG